ncbi:DUF2142 domain-containing protein [Arthrobacter sp. MI7-26]|uniref:DUF2142 domain-containing protein n=1 Tax=Arthrobacter sp. MI7-26 TaxID=2993653 RepID=UPI0022497DC5|nr:DUF2142 domain-containing protein [Arthrobacter sp. MI7-26]MCX2746525.1 DUF2142 domain-containing protein [Arthrobacter sp. MI7-26]
MLITLWTLATPLMAYPDEPAHTIKAAAVARGQFFPHPGESFGHGVHVQVPSYIANIGSQSCFAFTKEKPADCSPDIPLDDTYTTIGVTSAGLYNPLYYWLVGLPSLFMSGAPAIFAMRIVSGLMSAAFYAAGFTALSRLRHPKWPTVAAAMATTPMVLFLASGINPNSLEVAASMAAFCGLVSVLENSRQLHLARPGILAVGVSAATLANTRNVSLLWLLCGAIVACLFFRGSDIAAIFRNRVLLIVAGLSSLGVALGVIWNFVMLAAPPSAGEAPAGISNAVEGLRPSNAFVTMMDRSFDFVTQYIGVAGWLDASLPQAVLMFWNMLLIAILLMVLLMRPARLQLGFWVAIGMLAVVPALVQAALVTSSGFIWQGRYSLPLFAIAVISAGLALRFRKFKSNLSSRSLTKILLWAAWAAHVYGFVYILRRYVVGLPDSANWLMMLNNPSWQPPLSWEGLTLLFALSLVIGANYLYRFLHPSAQFLPQRLTGALNWLTRRRGTPSDRPESGHSVEPEPVR